MSPNIKNLPASMLVSKPKNSTLGASGTRLSKGLQDGTTLKTKKPGHNGSRIPTKQWSNLAELDAYLETFEEKQPTKWWDSNSTVAEIVSYGIRKVREYRAGNVVLCKVTRGRKNPYWEVAKLGKDDAYPFSQSLIGLSAWPFTTEKTAVSYFNKQLRKLNRA